MSITYSAPGHDGTALIAFPNQPTRMRRNGTITARFKYWCQTDLAHDGQGGLIPARFTTIADAGVTLYLVDAATRELEDPSMSEVTLTYNQSASLQEPISSEGDIEKRTEIIALSRKTSDPSAEGTDYETSFAVAEAEGEDVVPLYGVRYEYTETVRNFIWSEDNMLRTIDGGIGINSQVGAPPDITSVVDPTLWVFRGVNISETPRTDDGKGGSTPAIATLVETWEYSPIGWKGVIVQ